MVRRRTNASMLHVVQKQTETNTRFCYGICTYYYVPVGLKRKNIIGKRQHEAHDLLIKTPAVNRKKGQKEKSSNREQIRAPFAHEDPSRGRERTDGRDSYTVCYRSHWRGAGRTHLLLALVVLPLTTRPLQDGA